jgi:hypothetical protein
MYQLISWTTVQVNSSITKMKLKSKRKDWLTRNQDNVSERGDMFIRELRLYKSNYACWSSTKRVTKMKLYKMVRKVLSME